MDKNCGSNIQVVVKVYAFIILIKMLVLQQIIRILKL